MRRRRFDHLVTEISLEAGHRVPRFALWTALCDRGHDPETLTRAAALSFCDGPLAEFLRQHGLRLGTRPARRLRRRVARFDPRYPAPEDIFARL